VVEPCEDFRNEICVQEDSETGEGEVFRHAACVKNRWQECLSYNADEEAKAEVEEAKEYCNDYCEQKLSRYQHPVPWLRKRCVAKCLSTQSITPKCLQNPHCMAKTVDIDDYFKFTMCVPRYPPGFDTRTESGNNAAKSICNLASTKCTVVYVKTWRGWKCKYNCDCRNKEFTEKMNDLCRSLGDCGGYVNIVGEVSRDFKVTNAPYLSYEEIRSAYENRAFPVAGQYAEFGNITSYTEFFSIMGIPEEKLKDQKFWQQQGFRTLAKIGLGAMATSAIWLKSVLAKEGLKIGFVDTVKLMLGKEVTVSGTTLSIQAAAKEGTFFVQGVKEGASFGYLHSQTAATFANSVQAALAGASIGYLLANMFGLDEKTALGLSSVGAFTGYILVKQGVVSPATLFWVSLALMAVTILLGIGRTKKVIVEFHCLPWQAPFGGADCEKCNNRKDSIFGLSLKCSPYKCHSLGQACEFINEGTDQEMCVAVSSEDVTPPLVSPMFGMITEGYSYHSITDNGFRIKPLNKECIDPFELVSFGIVTNEPAQCKWDYENKRFEEMGNYFGTNSFTYNHTIQLYHPSNPALESQGLPLMPQQLKLYIKCEDVNGNVNDVPYIINLCVNPEPDKTPPLFNKIVPESGSAIKYGQEEKTIRVYLNEPAECRWDYEDKDFEAMQYNMTCIPEIEARTLYGWVCEADLFNISLGENTFYFRCKDHPWAEERERNTDKES